MKELIKRINAILLIVVILGTSMFSLSGCGSEDSDVIVLRVSNWEEYIDMGDWDEEDTIELEDGTVIFSESGIVEDFENWFYETYGKKVKVEYSTFGTNEELYNQITLGDTYDLVCPSEYMIMKMMREDMLMKYSDSFWDTSVETNYYVNSVSPYIKEVYDNLSIDGESISAYAAGYMWGTLGIVYNPEFVTEEEASHWKILSNEKFSKMITIKDSVRDAFFAGSCIYHYNTITEQSFMNDEDYYEKLTDIINATDKTSVDDIENILSGIKDNVYSFETDSGKADLVTGKVVANQQWSGDAVYTLDQAEEDGTELNYAVPEEASNLWFDGWVMLKDGIGENPDKQLAAEAFVNYISMPENAIRNMMYIGYTSVISGGESDMIFQYADWCYGADVEEAEEEGIELIEYNIDYFFSNDPSEEGQYTIVADESQSRRQLYAQYPTLEVMERCVVMACFNDEDNERINRMWTNVRCFDIGRWCSEIF